MAETRRKLFETSFLSIFGVMSAPAVLKAATLGDSVESTCNAALPVAGLRDDGSWVIFQQDWFGRYIAYRVTVALSSAPPNIDTQQLFEAQQAAGLHPIPSTVIVIRNGGSYSTDAYGVVKSNLGAMTTVKWNEIGHA